MKILIMGLGHLASYLVHELNKDYALWGTHRQVLTNPVFDDLHKIEFHAGNSFEKFPKGFDAIIWNFPPIENYTSVLQAADKFFSDDIPWIFVSSTSVFSTGVASEISKRKECHLTSLENQLKKLNRVVSILRPGGLVDEKRHPGNFFKERSLVTGAMTPVNLVHTFDVARFIHHVIKNNLWGDDYNLVSSQHQSKQEFYQQMLELKGYKGPKWSEKDSFQRIISNKKSIESGFHYQFDDLVAYFHNIG